MLQSEGMEIKKPHCDILSEKEFIASPAEIDAHRKVKLQNTEVLNINEKKYKETMLQSEGMENEKPRCEISSEKKFITSPADVDIQKSQTTGMQKFWTNIKKNLENCVKNIIIYSQRILQTQERLL